MLVAGAAVALTLVTAPAVPADPAPATVVAVRVTGDPAKRFNLVILGDGYTAADMPTFRADVDKHVNVLFTFEPFKSYRNYMNVYSVEIPSADSGVSCDPDLTSPRRNTPLHMAFWSGCDPNGIQRGLLMDENAATTYANLVPGTTPDNRQILAIANSTTYGGIGGTYATASGGNAMSSLITPHELGHSLGGLQDEYDYYSRGVRGGPYTGGEPDSVHHTLLTEQQMLDQHKKWWRWLGEPSEAGGTVGRYESGMYSSGGVWRPSEHSIMKTLGYHYDQVGREDMTAKISAKTSIVQDSTPTAQPIGADRVVWVEPMHPNSHQLDVTWSLDGNSLPTNNSRSVDLRGLGITAGRHTLTATVVDPTDFVRDPAIRAQMSRVLTWTVDASVTTPPSNTPVIFTDTTETDRAVGANDVVFADTTRPTDRIPAVNWALDGKPVPVTGNDLDLASLKLTGTHTLTATVEDNVRTWTVDATDPSTAYQLSNALLSVRKADGQHEYVYNGPFTMKLSATDDRPGSLVSEFQTDGDGWFNYFGWPTDSSAPWQFTPNGTEIDGLVYGKLGKPRLSPWDDATPSYGQHTIEYRTTDAAGNVATAQSFQVNLLPAPPTCTTTVTGQYNGPLIVSSGVTCLDHAQVSGAITVLPGASVAATNSTIAGSLAASGAAVELLDSTVQGSADISSVSQDVTIVGGRVDGVLSLSGNHTGTRQPVVAGVHVSGALACAGNSPAPDDIAAPDTVDGVATGQCSGL